MIGYLFEDILFMVVVVEYGFLFEVGIIEFKVIVCKLGYVR